MMKRQSALVGTVPFVKGAAQVGCAAAGATLNASHALAAHSIASPRRTLARHPIPLDTHAR
jgi:hypothetical protein